MEEGELKTTLTQNIPIPATFTFAPYFFSYIVSGTNSEYDYSGGGYGDAYVTGNTAGGNLTANVAYQSGGTYSQSFTFYVYIFANPV